MITKAELIRKIEHKAKGAKPIVKSLLLSGLERQSKAELTRIARKIRVTSNGDIRLT